MQGMFSTTRTRVLTAPQLLLVAVVVLSAQCAAQQDVCGRSCSSDVQCPDTRGVCTYCTNDVCQPAPTTCGDLPSNGKTSKPQLLVVRVLTPLLSTGDWVGTVRMVKVGERCWCQLACGCNRREKYQYCMWRCVVVLALELLFRHDCGHLQHIFAWCIAARMAWPARSTSMAVKA
jgi:hypothetical protein